MFSRIPLLVVLSTMKAKPYEMKYLEFFRSPIPWFFRIAVITINFCRDGGSN